MSKNWCLISLMVLAPLALEAQDTTAYGRNAERRRQVWGAMIPTFGVTQLAGNMGLLSAGTGWHLDRSHRLELSALAGFVPRYESSRTKLTTTLRLRYLPWNIACGDYWRMAPLTVSTYATAIYGNQFWVRIPDRYPNDYYGIPTTAIRISLAIGQQATLRISPQNRKHARSVSLYYEVGALGRYVMKALEDRDVPLGDILGLSLGIKVQYL